MKIENASKIYKNYYSVSSKFLHVYTYKKKFQEKQQKNNTTNNSQSKFLPHQTHKELFVFTFPLDIYLLHCRLYFHLAQFPY